MPGPQHEMPGRRGAEARERRVQRARARLHGARPLRGALEQVGAAHVADEHEVAGEDAEGLHARRLVRDAERDVLGRVPRRREHVEPHAARADGVAALHPPDARLGRPRVLPVRAALVREAGLGVRAACKLARAGEVVGVDVRLGHGNDREAGSLGGVEVGVDVAVRVDDDRLVRVGVAEEVARLGERVVVEAFEDHECMRAPGGLPVYTFAA